jgi:hypothetical protein
LFTVSAKIFSSLLDPKRFPKKDYCFKRWGCQASATITPRKGRKIMAYSDFTLEKVQKKFDLTISEDLDLFANVPELEPSILLTKFLAEYAQLALKINTEKARSEMIIAPILLDFRKQVPSKISLFSGSGF